MHLIERTAAATAVWRARQKRFKKKNPFISVSIARKGKEQSGRTEFLNLFFVFFFVFCFVILFSSLDQHDSRCVTIGVQVVEYVKSIYLLLDGGQEEEEKVNRISPHLNTSLTRLITGSTAQSGTRAEAEKRAK